METAQTTVAVEQLDSNFRIPCYFAAIACTARFDRRGEGIDDALNDLAQLDPQQAQVIELRFFAGLTIAETSEVLGISPATVERNWVTAKAWLFDQLNRAGKASGHRE